MTSQIDIENKAVVRRYWHGKFNERRPEILDEIQKRDIQYHSPSMQLNGIDEYKQAYGMYLSALHDTQLTIEELVAEGDKVMSRVSVDCTHKGELDGIPPTGKTLTVNIFTVFRLVDGKIAEEWEIVDELGLMHQLGMELAPVGNQPEANLTSASNEESELLMDLSQQSDLNTLALNRQLVKDVFAAIDKHDYDQLQALWPEDMKCFVAGLPEPMSRDETIEFISNWYTIFPDYTHEIQDVVADGNKVMIRVTNHATHQNEFEGSAPTGRKIAYEAVHMVTIEGGAISEWWLLEDDLGFRLQLGMELIPPSDE